MNLGSEVEEPDGESEAVSEESEAESEAESEPDSEAEAEAEESAHRTVLGKRDHIGAKVKKHVLSSFMTSCQSF
jgi:hypothetical protein